MIDILLILFLILLGVVIISIIVINDLFTLILITSLISVLSAVIYVLLDAIDVAITEVVVGSGISTILMLITMHLTKNYNIDGKNPIERFSKISPANLFTSGLILVIFFLLLDGLAYAPIFGDATAPANSNIIYKVYTKSSYETFKVQNAVTMVLGAFRGYDTFGETTVVLIAAIGVYLVLQKENLGTNIKIPVDMTILPFEESNMGKLMHNRNKHKPKEFILSSAVFALLPILLLFGFYVQFHGDFGPGGGFQAGVIIASVYFLVILYFGKQVANSFMNIKILVKSLALGVLIYGGTGIVTMLLGGKYLDYLVFGNDPSHSYHYGLFAIELGVGITVFAATATIISQFYNKVKN